MNRILAILFSIAAIGLTVLPGCSSFDFDKEETTAADSTLTVNQHIYKVFKEWYLWNEQLPDIDPDSFATVDALVDTLRNPLFDRWSYVTSYSELQKVYSQSEYTGFGGGFMVDADGIIKISHVYNDSPLGRSGIQRGWKVISANGTNGNDYAAINQILSTSDTVTFEMADLADVHHTLNLVKTAVKMNTVLYSEIINFNGHKVGYLVFDSFLQNSTEELNTVFTEFANQGISDLIVDLRYNGGGLISVSNHLIGLIGGKKVLGKTISSIEHNKNKTALNSSYKVNKIGPSANTQKVCVITTNQTASASELVINLLEPFMTVQLVGSPTHGKPVGMYIQHVDYYDLAIVPISFTTLNAERKADYYDGIDVDVVVADDLNHPWGNREESMLKSALNLIDGSVAVAELKTKKTVNGPVPLNYRGINQIVQAY